VQPADAGAPETNPRTKERRAAMVMSKQPGPHKDWDEEKTAAYIELNYEFLEHLWGEERKWGDPKDPVTLRHHLLSCQNEEALRAALQVEDINIDADVRIMLVDIETAQTKMDEPKINPAKDAFYVLVLPPKLRRQQDHNFMEVQAWRGAYYHAFSDGYGM
jgi:hypothetical protein